MTQQKRVGIVGATGLVGREIISILEENALPVRELNLFASMRTAGEIVEFKGKGIVVKEIQRKLLQGHDIIFFASGGDVSREFCPYAAQVGALVIDNSSEFRMEEKVPLVVPEVNPEKVFSGPGIISNPNCSTIQMVVALKSLHEAAQLKRIVVSTYQSVSGVGKEATEELFEQVRCILSCQEIKAEVFSQQIAFNIIPHIDYFHPNHYSNEELKMERETQKIFADPTIRVTATCVRVPTFVGHGAAINAEFHKPLTLEKSYELLGKAPGVMVVDNPSNSEYPTPIQSVDRDEVMVGRLRIDQTVSSGLNMWIVANNLRKGAALNAVQIAQEWLKHQYE
ncbi:aspartate-semialdehyde dehydrogenase [bacterium]|nr:aspartate-semialdehyde dehydrogenase [bacterium]